MTVAVGCGGGDEEDGSTARPTTLVLDFVPNAVHAGIYRALAAGYYEREGIELEIVEPSSTADTLRLIAAGRADLGLADGLDVAGQIARGRDARAVLAVLQRPAGGVIALAGSGIDSPADLEGRRVAITGVPSDEAVLEAVVAGAGGDPARVDPVTVGFKGVQSLLAGRVAAMVGFVPADGAQIEAAGREVRAFPLDRWGGPRYPGLVAFTSSERLAAEPELIAGFAAATIRGYEDTLADPERSLDDLLAANPELDRELAAATLHAYLDYFTVPGRELGEIAPGAVRAMSRFGRRAGILARPITPAGYGAPSINDA